MITGFHHAALSVSDMAKALEFYCDVIGFTEIDRGRWSDSDQYDAIWNLKASAGEYAMLRMNDAYLEIFQFESPKPRLARHGARQSDFGITHLCLSVDDIGGEYQRLSKAGVMFTSPPVDADGWCAFGSDPFGNVIELYQPA